MPSFYVMPSGRRRMKRNGGSRRGFKWHSAGSAWTMRKAYHGRKRRARAIAVINQSARGFTGIEVKFYDQKLIGAALTTNTDASGGEHDPSATLMMNTVTQGDGESQRDGRRITMKSIYVLGNIDVNSKTSQSSADVAAQIFIALIMDTQTNGATIASENVFVNPGANAIMGAHVFRNLQFTKRFKILATRKFTLQDPTMVNATSFSADNGVIQAGIQKSFKMFVKLNTVVNFTGTTETIANIADNSLHLIAWCSSTTLVPKISYSSRLRFVG